MYLFDKQDSLFQWNGNLILLFVMKDNLILTFVMKDDLIPPVVMLTQEASLSGWKRSFVPQDDNYPPQSVTIDRDISLRQTRFPVPMKDDLILPVVMLTQEASFS